MEAFAGELSISEPASPPITAFRGRSPRLLEVGLSWPPETFVMLKLRSLADRGVDVRVGSFPVSMAPAPEPPGVSVEALPDLRGGRRALAALARELTDRDPRGLRRLLVQIGRGLPLRLWRLYLHLLRAQPDLLHFEWLTVATRCLPLLERWEGPVVISCRGSELTSGQPLSNQARPTALQGIFERADAVHVVSEAKLAEALALGLDPAKATIIRPAVDADVFHPASSSAGSPSQFKVVSVAWLRWLKGHEYGLQAIAELAREGIPVSLEILGGDPPGDMDEPSQRARIVHTARDLGIEDRVHLAGHLSPEAVSARLRGADAFLHPSVSEGLPNVLVEAMACGLPSVATDVGGTREALRDGVEGFLVPARDPGAAARALRILWREPQARLAMGIAARARVEAEFTVRRQTDQWVGLYERVLGERLTCPGA